jgi:hydrogenase maturation protein HypF
VVRTHVEHTAFIRRSRGYAPAPLLLKEIAKQCTLALGGELNNTACILNRDKAFISQHIGDVENIETRDFLDTAAKHLITLTNSKIDTIACDMHPKFNTTALAHELAEENSWQLQQVQHHHAHITALMEEHDVNEIVGICCDGYGYGLDGEAWGGEILLCSKEQTGFKRLAHLEKQPLVGGDLATRYPLRVAAGILRAATGVEEFLFENKQYFPHEDMEIEIILQQLKNRKVITETTSCGRVLDAVSAVLGVCYERTYEGEPSMKLESTALKGKDILKLKPLVKNNVLQTTPLLQEIFENRNKYTKRDLACSAHVYLANGLAQLAIQQAEDNNVKTVGFSGGVACNEIMARNLRKKVEAVNIHFLMHGTIPPGDGGLSFGQAVASGFFKL